MRLDSHYSISHPSELAALNALQTPTWIFDIEKVQMWWANQAALHLWGASSLEELLNRNWSEVSEATRTRLKAYLQQFQQGETVIEQWTFYPQGQAVPVRCVCSGIYIESGRLAMLVEGVTLAVEAIDSDILRCVEALRHTTVMISLYTANGDSLMQNPAAMNCYGPENKVSPVGDAFSQRFADSKQAEAAQVAIEAGEVFSLETQVQTLKGLRWHGVDVRRTNDPATGNPMILVNEKDITDRKLAEATLQKALAQLAQANQEIALLNQRLQNENLRMSAELEITRHLQQLILPKVEELELISELDIAGFMEPADEVGGDYYDVLCNNGHINISIGDVTGHGLESGVLMIMVQTAVRALLANQETDPFQFFTALNHTIYDNVQRMNSDKNLSLIWLDYHDHLLSISGQHEEVIIVRASQEVLLVDTNDLGFPIALDVDITDFISKIEVPLYPGDVVVLYTDGITEAEDMDHTFYGLERLVAVVQQNQLGSASEIKQAVIDDLRQHIGTQKVYDDMTLLVLKHQ
ncbi:MAG: SpoIIE family protein phosphatase [Actinomycetota bacterium]